MSSEATPPETLRLHIVSMIFTLGWVGTVIADPHFSRHLLVIGERDDSGEFTTWRGTEPHHDTRPTPADRAAVASVVRGVADEVEGGGGAAGGRSAGGRGIEASSGATRAAPGDVVTDTTIKTSDWQAVIATNAKHASHLFLIGDPPEPPDPYDEDDEDEEDEPAVRPYRRSTPADRVAAAAVLRALAEEIEATA
jgi:hypothetical protein